MVEEVFEAVEKSNSQIYLNDHLSPYFNRLFLIARKAKKDGKLASASSYGGKIRARKSLDDAPILITTEKQLQLLIDAHDDNSTNSLVQLVNDNMVTQQSTPKPSTSQHSEPHNQRTRSRTHKPKTKPALKEEAKKRKNNIKYDTNREIHAKKLRSNSSGHSSSSTNGNAHNTQ